MPSSTFAAISPIMGAIDTIKPISVLDVGCGNGKYGFLCREYIKYWMQKEPVIHGIEGFKPYVTGWKQKGIYDHIEVGNAIDILDRRIEKLNGVQYYDVVLAIDILEHFDEEKGKRFIGQLKQIGKNVIICMPTIVKEQGACFGNEYEIHRKQWTVDEIEPDENKRVVFVGKENFTVVGLGEKAEARP